MRSDERATEPADIVTRLLVRADDAGHPKASLYREAANEISRLREVAREHADRADNLRCVLDGVGEAISHAE